MVGEWDEGGSGLPAYQVAMAGVASCRKEGFPWSSTGVLFHISVNDPKK